MRRVLGAALVVFALVGDWLPAEAGHELTYYPSFYPQEIRIEPIAPAPAAALFQEKTLHAYIGSAPRFEGSVPDHLKSAESLGSFLLLTFNPASEVFKGRERRCAGAGGIMAALALQTEDFIFHPYPVTPFHSDYLHHLDRVQDFKETVLTQRPVNLPLKFRAQGQRAEALVRSRWKLDSGSWDASLEEVPLSRLMSGSAVRLNGWHGPPWKKEGWFQAYRLLAPVVSSPEEKRTAAAIYQRLVRGQYGDLRERLNLERRLVSSLTRSCERVVVGYAPRREYYNDDFSAGVQNIAFDSHLGLNSSIFVRTVKLKDFPWNGWLRLGIDEKPEAAWNPIAGFADGPGRLIWSALGDPALLPLPYNSSWISNRAVVDPKWGAAQDRSKGTPVPAGALLPEPGTGALRPVGKGKFSATKLTYRVLASPFHDGSQMDVADLLYPYVLAYRWGVKTRQDEGAYDPVIEAATGLIRSQLVGLRVVGVDRKVSRFAPDVTALWQILLVQVFLNYVSPDSQQVAALAPPWSPVPWHLLVLMEEAVRRGFAAFSKEEAERREVGWLDLARDESLKERLRGLVEEFERKRYRPAALEDLVPAEAARLRWGALKKFARESGHFIVTNGPYRLKGWSQDSTVLEVVRELSYPLGLGTFDRYAYPPRAVITAVKREANRVALEVDVEKVVKMQRTYTTVRERLRRETTRGLYGIRPESRYLLVGPDGSVVSAGTARLGNDERFVADLPARLPRGQYAFLVAIYPDGNTVNPSLKILRFRVNGT